MLSIDPRDERFRWLFERLWSLATAAAPESKLFELEPLNLLSLLDLERMSVFLIDSYICMYIIYI